MAFRHALHAQRKHGRHDGRQTFRHCGDCKRYAQNEHIENGREAVHLFHDEDRRDHHDGNDDDGDPELLADTVERLLKRCNLVRRLLQHPGDASHLGLHPCGRDHGAAAPVTRGGAAEDHVGRVAEPDFLLDHSDALRHGQALAGERRLGHLQSG
jgi:hypothetical protein